MRKHKNVFISILCQRLLKCTEQKFITSYVTRKVKGHLFSGFTLTVLPQEMAGRLYFILCICFLYLLNIGVRMCIAKVGRMCALWAKASPFVDCYADKISPWAKANMIFMEEWTVNSFGSSVYILYAFYTALQYIKLDFLL